jgi:hypothetical protein
MELTVIEQVFIGYGVFAIALAALLIIPLVIVNKLIARDKRRAQAQPQLVF